MVRKGVLYIYSFHSGKRFAITYYSLNLSFFTILDDYEVVNGMMTEKNDNTSIQNGIETSDKENCSNLNEITVESINFDQLQTLVLLCAPENVTDVNSTDVEEWRNRLIKCKNLYRF